MSFLEKEEVSKKLIDYWKLIEGFVKKNQDWLVAIWLASSSVLIYLIINNPQEFQDKLKLSRRYLISILLAIQLLGTYFICYFTRGWNLMRKVVVWLQSNILTLFVFVYYIRLNNSNLEVAGVGFSTQLSVVLLTILIFLVNLNLFGKYQQKFSLKLAQIFLFVLCSFAFFGFISDDKTNLRSFFSEFFNYIFTNIHPFVWLVLSSLAIAVTSILDLKVNNLRNLFKYFAVFWFITLQSLIGVYLFSLSDLARDNEMTYWYFALMSIILWDMFYQPMVGIIKETPDYQFRQRAVVSGFYHFVLFVLVVYYEPIERFIEKLY